MRIYFCSTLFNLNSKNLLNKALSVNFNSYNPFGANLIMELEFSHRGVAMVTVTFKDFSHSREIFVEGFPPLVPKQIYGEGNS